MKNNYFFKISILLALTAIMAPAAWALSGSYQQSISLGGQVVAEFKVTAKGEKVRTEFPGQENAEIILRNDSGTYRYSPSQNLALKLPDELNKESLLDDMDNYLGFLEKNGAQRTGEEKIREYDTDVYEFQDPVTQNPAKAWVLKDKGFPVQILINAPEGELKIEITDIQLEGEVDESVFEVPAEAKVINMEDLYQQMPQMPDMPDMPQEMTPAAEE